MTNETKHITVKIDIGLHAQIREYVEAHGMTMAEFVCQALDNELHPKIQMKELNIMANSRTIAFQVPEDLFQRIKEYLARNNMTQRQFFLGLIEAELDRDQAERNSIREGDPDESVSEEEETEARDHDGNEPALPEDPDSGVEPEGSADPQDYEQTM